MQVLFQRNDLKVPIVHPRRLGAVGGGGEKSKRARKKYSGEEKSRARGRAPGDKVLTDQFQTVGVVLASDWCQRNLNGTRDWLKIELRDQSCMCCILCCLPAPPADLTPSLAAR